MRMIAALLLAVAGSMAARQTRQPVWVMQASGTTAGLRGIDSVDGTVVWAGGAGGTVPHTTDSIPETY